VERVAFNLPVDMA